METSACLLNLSAVSTNLHALSPKWLGCISKGASAAHFGMTGEVDPPNASSGDVGEGGAD